jgi:hypothetical protein
MCVKNLFLLFLSSVLILPGTIFSQSESNLNVDLGATLVSRHIWRGIDIGGAKSAPVGPHLQPHANFIYQHSEKSSVTLGFLGTYGINSPYSESDFLINFNHSGSAGDFRVQLFDYHYPITGINFSNFENDGTGAHTLELSVLYSLPENFPLSIFVSRNVYNVIEDDHTFYSSLRYPLEVDDITIDLFIGAALGESQWHAVTNKGFTLTNLGFSASRPIRISESFSMPLGISWIFNPHQDISYITMSLSL